MREQVLGLCNGIFVHVSTFIKNCVFSNTFERKDSPINAKGICLATICPILWEELVTFSSQNVKWIFAHAHPVFLLLVFTPSSTQAVPLLAGTQNQFFPVTLLAPEYTEHYTALYDQTKAFPLFSMLLVHIDLFKNAFIYFLPFIRSTVKCPFLDICEFSDPLRTNFDLRLGLWCTAIWHVHQKGVNISANLHSFNLILARKWRLGYHRCWTPIDQYQSLSHLRTLEPSTAAPFHSLLSMCFTAVTAHEEDGSEQEPSVGLCLFLLPSTASSAPSLRAHYSKLPLLSRPEPGQAEDAKGRRQRPGLVACFLQSQGCLVAEFHKPRWLEKCLHPLEQSIAC